MSETHISRRALVATAAVLPLAAAASVRPAQAQAANMRAALNHLQQALGALQTASPGEGGHRAEAIRLTRAAIDQDEQGIAFARNNS
jgi:hypothetical protein